MKELRLNSRVCTLDVLSLVRIKEYYEHGYQLSLLTQSSCFRLCAWFIKLGIWSFMGVFCIIQSNHMLPFFQEEHVAILESNEKCFFVFLQIKPWSKKANL